MSYYVYIITNPTKTTLYTGVTNDLARCMAEHRENRGNPASFAGKYHCYKLLYYETFQNINDARGQRRRMFLLEGQKGERKKKGKKAGKSERHKKEIFP
ncbi:GIY-YIG nuclease family protein [Xanthocytophaga agilis]|uniref:GIY-YIG nuclease family protein n=1 Tax=Xanthocytophaga agilis TaxID=3048010 RepID=A0AAE3R2N8_9BACT|nr:GIY-YIG nuclease family protein [Xanthocytophaga agilis]MDJ1500214.1 GIY-YIG nuclease family protein [Xanthocytophaga agilis]